LEDLQQQNSKSRFEKLAQRVVQRRGRGLGAGRDRRPWKDIRTLQGDGRSRRDGRQMTELRVFWKVNPTAFCDFSRCEDK
jgi:hypothetical protein